MFNIIIFITGTPGVGKTTISKVLQNQLNSSYNVKLIEINNLAIENNLIMDENYEKDYKIIDIDKLNIFFQKDINTFLKLDNNNPKAIIVEGHLSHFCLNPDFVFVLRLDPEILKKRLLHRNYPSNKIKENLEAESLAICSNEAYELHKNKVHEIDTSFLDTIQLLNVILEVINNKKEYPPGNINYMDWLVNNS